jgi:anaerobic ribonucleoside-triphosphate reductase activating protein
MSQWRQSRFTSMSVHGKSGPWLTGPGERFVLWLQGCPILCPGCFNEDLLPFVQRHIIDVAEMAATILGVAGIEGVTYSGGEPTGQAQGLALLSERLRAAGLTVVCYTGYTLEALQARDDSWINRLLSYVDILIDGPFVRDKAANLLEVISI